MGQSGTLWDGLGHSGTVPGCLRLGSGAPELATAPGTLLGLCAGPSPLRGSPRDRAPLGLANRASARTFHAPLPRRPAAAPSRQRARDHRPARGARTTAQPPHGAPGRARSLRPRRPRAHAHRGLPGAPLVDHGPTSSPTALRARGTRRSGARAWIPPVRGALGGDRRLRATPTHPEGRGTRHSPDLHGRALTDPHPGRKGPCGALLRGPQPPVRQRRTVRGRPLDDAPDAGRRTPARTRAVGPPHRHAAGLVVLPLVSQGQLPAPRARASDVLSARS